MKTTIVIITGLAGSGKTVALRALEDRGFYCVDNLPITLIEPLAASLTTDSRKTNIGLDIDIREKEFFPAIDSVLAKLRGKYDIEIVFLEAEKDILLRRFKETRRPHPLAAPGGSLEDAIESEKDILLPLRKEAARLINTSTFSPYQLRQLISSFYNSAPRDAVLSITLISFGYKYGIPQNADLLFDVRFIQNPYFVPALKENKGTDTDVKAFVLDNLPAKEFLDKTAGLLNFLIPQYISEGRPYLTIGIGCTGGRHRSPAMTEAIARLIKNNTACIAIIHRDMEP